MAKSPLVCTLRAVRWWFWFGLCVGCGAASVEHHVQNPKDYRALAQAHPKDPELALRWAEAELFGDGGDIEGAKRAIEAAAALGASPLYVSFLKAIEAEHHGRLDEFVELALRVIELAVGSSDSWAPLLAESAALGLSEYQGDIPNCPQRVGRRLERALASSTDPRVRWWVGKILIELAYRKGDLKEVERWARALGCATKVRAIGPFGPHEMLGFDEAFPPERDAVLAKGYDLGFGRGRRPTREIEAKGCTLELGGPIPMGGTTYVEWWVDLEEGGPYALRLDTPNPYPIELWVDGVSRLRFDARKEPKPRTIWHVIELSQGRHRILLKLSSRHRMPVVELALAKGGIPPLPDLGSQELEKRRPIVRYLRLIDAIAHGDGVGARGQAEKWRIEEMPLVLLNLSAIVMLNDPLRAATVNRNEAKQRFLRARDLDSNAWMPHYYLAHFEAREGRFREAVVAFREGKERFSEVLGFATELVDLLSMQEWHEEVDAILAELRERFPGVCRPLRASLNRALERKRYEEALRHAEALVRCDARSDAMLQVQFRRHKWAEVEREIERLSAFEKKKSRTLDALLNLALSRGDEEESKKLLRELREELPLESQVVAAEFDWLLARGRAEEARHLLEQAIEREPIAMNELRWLLRSVFAESPLERYREDGMAIIRAFEESGRQYANAPQVLVWDSSVTYVFPEGGVAELIHQIYRVQSEEAIDDLGQLRLPEDALPLRIRTIKPDKSSREPERIGRLAHIELPALEVGDYVEHEYLRMRPPPLVFQGGVMGERFYFQSFEVPFDTSRLILIVPKDAEVVIDPRGQAPPLRERVEGEHRILHWEVRGSPALVPEPNAPAAREFIPSILWGIRARWEDFVARLRDGLADRSVRDPGAERLVRSIVGPAPLSEEEKIRRIHRWVIDNIEPNRDLLGQAAVMLSARAGDRPRILAYLLELAGFRADLALVRNFTADATPSLLPEEETYNEILVRAQTSRGFVWLDANARRASWKVISPFLRGQEAMLITPTSERVRVPEGSDDDDLREVEVELYIDSQGGARAEVIERYHGAPASFWRNQLADIPRAQLERLFEQNYAYQVLPGALLRRLEVEGQDDYEAPLVLRYTVESDEIGRLEGRVRMIPWLFPAQAERSLAPLPRRHLPEIVFPLFYRIHLRIHPPPGWSLEAPIPQRIGEEPGPTARFEVMPSAEGLTILREVRVPRMRVQPAEYQMLVTFSRALDAYEAREIRMLRNEVE
ncbi:MAG: DUF3857 domain-containing protein [Sandaracinaceae bacterium]|nr:DUF3857 domain-containing protein [Sandaracinaceae bacterium]